MHYDHSFSLFSLLHSQVLQARLDHVPDQGTVLGQDEGGQPLGIAPPLIGRFTCIEMEVVLTSDYFFPLPLLFPVLSDILSLVIGCIGTGGNHDSFYCISTCIQRLTWIGTGCVAHCFSL